MRAGGSRCLACDINCIRRKDSCMKMGSEAILGSVGEDSVAGQHPQPSALELRLTISGTPKRTLTVRTQEKDGKGGGGRWGGGGVKQEKHSSPR